MRMREGAMFGCARALCCAAIYGYGSAEPYSSGIARLRRVLRWISAAISTSLCLSQSPAPKIAVVIGATSEVQASLLPLCSAFETPRSRLDRGRGLALRRRVLLLVIEARLFGVQRRVRLVRRKAI